VAFWKESQVLRSCYDITTVDEAAMIAYTYSFSYYDTLDPLKSLWGNGGDLKTVPIQHNYVIHTKANYDSMFEPMFRPKNLIQNWWLPGCKAHCQKTNDRSRYVMREDRANLFASKLTIVCY
jgi:hypothetical protein